MALPTTVVGSWWHYDDEAEELARLRHSDPTSAATVKLVDAWASRAIAEQQEIGFSEWTSGEYHVENFVGSLPKYLTGITLDEAMLDEEYDYDDLGHVTITGPIEAPHGLGYADAFRRHKDLPGGVKKATVVTPFEVMLPAMGDQLAEVNAQMPNLLGIINREVRALADAGCPHIQVDAPVIAVMVNEGHMAPDDAASILAACFAGVSGVTRGVHFCNGNNRGRPFSGVLRIAPWVPILQRLDGVLDVALLEASYWSEWCEREALKDVPQSIDLAIGLLDEADYSPMPVKKIQERAAGWARVVGEDRLWLSPSCGFGRHPSSDRSLLERKVRNLNEAAARF